MGMKFNSMGGARKASPLRGLEFQLYFAWMHAMWSGIIHSGMKCRSDQYLGILGLGGMRKHRRQPMIPLRVCTESGPKPIGGAGIYPKARRILTRLMPFLACVTGIQVRDSASQEFVTLQATRLISTS